MTNPATGCEVFAVIGPSNRIAVNMLFIDRAHAEAHIFMYGQEGDRIARVRIEEAGE